MPGATQAGRRGSNLAALVRGASSDQDVESFVTPSILPSSA